MVREALRNPIAVLKSLSEKTKDKDYKFKRLYRNLYNPEFYWLAYKNIYANKGSMTEGVDGTTMSNMNDRRIEKIINFLKDKSYKPNPARRIYIAKKNSSKKRPLGIQSGDDKLVQEVVRMILESIFEPNFLKSSHGFRPRKSCHTALMQIHDTFTGAKWFVEGDIKACFDSFDHHVIIELLRKRIEDEMFISLMWKFLKSGYMEQWTYGKTYDGVPQGSGVSPILSNIYLNELDKFMQEYKLKFDIGKPKDRKVNPEYRKAYKATYFYKRKGKGIWDSLNENEKEIRAKELKRLQIANRSMPHRMPTDDNFKSIQYARYADDFLIGIIGSRQDAEAVKNDVKQFLADRLKLTMSEEKTKITHTGDRARFLGYDICVSRDQTAKKKSDGKVQRCHSGVVKLLVPREKWVSKLLEYGAIRIIINENGKEKYKSIHRTKLINRMDIEILSKFNSEIRGLYNFYSIANDAYKIGKFANIMKYSMFKTFANKYKTNVNRIKARYIKGKDFTVAYQTKSGIKQVVFYNKGFKRKLEPSRIEVSLLPQYRKYEKFNSLRSRVKFGLCEMCDKKSKDITLHQVKRLKDLKGDKPWERVMLDRYRKTIAVCPDCYKQIMS